MRKRRWIWAATAAVIAVVVIACVGGTKEGSRGILYEVRTERSVMYLLGSIHIGESAMYPFGSEIQEALKQAETFVFECDTDDAEATARMRARMALPEGETLQAAVGEERYGQLRQVCEKLGMQPDALDGYQPWAAMNTLSVHTTAAEMGEDSLSRALSLGVEKRVKRQIGGRPVRYLETLDEQVDTLAGFSPALLDYLLADECAVILGTAKPKGLDATVASWPGWWKAGDAQAFAEQYLAGYPDPEHEAESREYHNSLMTRRNERMADGLAALLEEGGTYFVTVGLLHLVLPEDSVTALLQARGYSVECVSQP